MGIYASYYAVDDGQLKAYRQIDDDDTLIELFDEIEEQEDGLSTDLDKLWDGLHYLITGFNSDDDYNADKSEYDLLIYYAFFGQDALMDDNEECFYIDSGNVKKALAVLQQVDIDARLVNVDFAKFHQAQIYPDIWDDDEHDGLKDELKDYFEQFVAFYRQVAANNQAVIITIC